MIDLTGKTFGRLTVERLSSKRAKNYEFFWICRCSCGKSGVEVKGSNLLSGQTHSCGCLMRETRAKFIYVTAHGGPVVTVQKKCAKCQRLFTVSYREFDSILRKNAEQQKSCNICILRKRLGTKVSKDDW